MRALLLAALVASPASAAVNVAVLYFDNHTALREYDVLQKGMADMLITDLSAAPGLQLVEREKLEAVLQELELQRSKYFDPATAVRVGKLLGAGYAVTGAFTGFSPEVRIDVRLIETATGAVVASAQVKGQQGAFFELEQELVRRFLDALQVKLGAKATGGAVTLDTALRFSQGLDSADQGDVKGASTRLASVVRASPDFALGKARYRELLDRLRQAGQKREQALSADEKLLVAGIDAALARWTGKVLEEAPLEAYFCYRAMRTAYLMWKLEKVAGPPRGVLGYRVPAKADRPAAEALLRALWDNEVALMADAAKNHQRLQYHNHSLSCPMALAQLKYDDFYRLKTLAVPWYHMPRVHPADRTPLLVGFASTGSYRRATFDEDEAEIPTLKVLPTLIALDQALVQKSLGLLDQAQQHLALPVSRSVPEATIELEVARTTVLVNAGRREEGIAALQACLDRFPKSKAYRAVEGEVEDLLGVSARAQEDGAALLGCRASDEALRREVDRLLDAEGKGAVEKAVAALDASCPAGAQQVRAVAAWGLAMRGDCAGARALASGAAEADAAGVRDACAR